MIVEPGAPHPFPRKTPAQRKRVEEWQGLLAQVLGDDDVLRALRRARRAALAVDGPAMAAFWRAIAAAVIETERVAPSFCALVGVDLLPQLGCLVMARVLVERGLEDRIPSLIAELPPRLARLSATNPLQLDGGKVRLEEVDVRHWLELAAYSRALRPEKRAGRRREKAARRRSARSDRRSVQPARRGDARCWRKLAGDRPASRLSAPVQRRRPRMGETPRRSRPRDSETRTQLIDMAFRGVSSRCPRQSRSNL